MSSEIVVRPGPGSFAPRVAADVRAALSAEGVDAGPDGWRVTLPDGGRVVLHLDEREGELQAVRVGGGEGAWAVAARLARALNWNVVDEKGHERSALELRRRASLASRVRPLLAVAGGAMALLFGLAWAVRRGSELVDLLLALAGMGLYAAMRVWGWLGRRLARDAARGGGVRG